MEGFDPDQNTRFSTYASWWIKQSIKRSLINSDKPIHIPAYMVEMISRFRESREQFIETEGRQPTVDELADRLEMSVSKVNHIRNAVKAVSTPTHDTESVNGVGLTESIADPRTLQPEDILFNEAQATRIVGLLESLDERESRILKLRYGLDGGDPLTLKEIGTKIRLTRERAPDRVRSPAQDQGTSRRRISRTVAELVVRCRAEAVWLRAHFDGPIGDC